MVYTCFLSRTRRLCVGVSMNNIIFPMIPIINPNSLPSSSDLEEALISKLQSFSLLLTLFKKFKEAGTHRLSSTFKSSVDQTVKLAKNLANCSARLKEYCAATRQYSQSEGISVGTLDDLTVKLSTLSHTCQRIAINQVVITGQPPRTSYDEWRDVM